MSWPTHADGTNKKMGEMTREEQREQFRAAGRRLQDEFENPLVQQKLSALLSGVETKH